jgi:PTH1 family peptidyl-tRNA hydrolase
MIIGLGNPGRKYENSRHNIGFRVVDCLAERWGITRTKEKFRGEISEGRTSPGGPRVILLKPLTFMNESGKSAGPAAGSNRVPLERIIVIHDEIDLPFGEIRTRMGGGLAGHNGLKSLRQGFGSPDFWRVRVGVDRPDSTDPERVAAFVLGPFTEGSGQVRDLIESAADFTESLVEQQHAVTDGEEERET